MAHPQQSPLADFAGLTLLRPLAALVVVVVGYALVPVQSGATAAAALVTSVVSVVVFGWTLRRQARRIIRSDHPTAAAAEALAILVSLFVVSFSLIYLAMSADEPSAFSQPLDKMGALYFAMTILSTVGFGDIVAVSAAARGTVVVQMVADLVLLALVTKLILGIANWARQSAATNKEIA
jgi:hypothetical protein